MILFLFTIMLMNLNKENEFTNPELQDWERSFLLLDNCRFNFGLHQLKPIIGEYIVLEKIINL
jgi:hypothetical protein